MRKPGFRPITLRNCLTEKLLVKKVEIVPLEVIVRNIAAGSFAKKLGMEEGIVLKRPTLEFSYKNDDLHDPFINALLCPGAGSGDRGRDRYYCRNMHSRSMKS